MEATLDVVGQVLVYHAVLLLDEYHAPALLAELPDGSEDGDA